MDYHERVLSSLCWGGAVAKSGRLKDIVFDFGEGEYSRLRDSRLWSVKLGMMMLTAIVR